MDSHSNANQRTDAAPSPERWAALKEALTLSRVQAVVGTAAGIASIAGALVSLPLWHATRSGQLVATVQDAASHRRVADATIEVLTPQRDIVATLSPDASGRAAGDLNEGTYVVRVSHPRYAVDERRVLIQPRRTVEITANLRTGSSTSLERTVGDGVRAVRRALRF